MDSLKTFIDDLMDEDKVLELYSNIEYEYYQDKGLYIYKLNCDNYWPTIGYSKYLIEARMIAYKNMLFNIEHNILYEIKEEANLEEEFKNDEYEFHIKHMNEELEPYKYTCKLGESLKNTKATKEEKEVEEFELSDSYIFNNNINWNYMSNEEKKQLLDKELDEYRKSDPDREKLPFLKVPVAKPSTPVFGRPITFYKVKTHDLGFDYKV